MAQAGKLSEEVRKKYERVEKPRKVDVRDARTYYLIVCEGAKTEPLYFQSLINLLPFPVIELCRFDVEGVGRNTTSLIEYALEKRDSLERMNMRVIDKLWIVFDKDSFEESEFNNAIAKCHSASKTDRKVDAAWSNEAFELWYLLHFNYHDTGIVRDQYKGILSREISQKAGKAFECTKNDPGMFVILKEFGDQNLAIKFAKRLIAENWIGKKDYAKHNPCTKVYVLVEELNDLENSLKKNAT